MIFAGNVAAEALADATVGDALVAKLGEVVIAEPAAAVVVVSNSPGAEAGRTFVGVVRLSVVETRCVVPRVEDA